MGNRTPQYQEHVGNLFYGGIAPLFNSIAMRTIYVRESKHPNVKDLPQARPGLVWVFFKEQDKYLQVSLRMLDRLLHHPTQRVRHTNHYGWMCMEEKNVIVKRIKS